MNFRDLYKSANGNIEGNRGLIDLVYEKSERKQIISFKYAALCAACLILVISLSVFPAFRNSNSTPDVQIAKNAPDKTVSKPKKAENDNQDTKEITDEISTDNDIEKKQDNNFNTVSDNSSVYIREDVSDTDRMEDSIGTESDEHMSATLEAAPEETQVSSASGGSAPYMVRAAKENSSAISRQMTRQSYFEYLGIENLNFETSLPDNMKFDMPEIVSIVTDSRSEEMVDDALQLVALDAQDETKILTLTTTRVSDLAFAHNAISEINGITVKKFIGEAGHSAYFEYSNACITVNSYGLSEEDLDLFIKKLIK